MKDDGSKQILPVDWVATTQRGEASTNYLLQPGDRLYVKATPPRTQGELAEKVALNPSDPEVDTLEAERKLDTVLREWATASNDWQIHYRFRQTEQRAGYSEPIPKTISRGEAFVRKPDLLRVVFQDEKGKLKGILASNGKEVHCFNAEDGSVLSAQRAEFDAYERICWAFGGFPLGDLKKRFDVRLAKEDDYYTYVDLLPKSKADQANFTRMRVVLARKERWVRQLWVKEANGRSVTIDYEEPNTNPEPPITPESIMRNIPRPADTDVKKERTGEKK
jgi:hypothetical protein